MSLSMLTVTGGVNGWRNLDGSFPPGTVLIQPVQAAAGGGWIIAATPKTFHLSSGNITGSIANNSQITGLQYLVTEQIVGASNPAPYVVTPTGSTLDLSTASRNTTGDTSTFVPQSAVGAPNGVATLDNTGNVPLAQLGNATGSSGVASFNSRTGIVVPTTGDYTPTQVGADASGAASTAQTAAQTFATNAVGTETARAEAAEGANATAISNEVTRAEGAETTLTSSVSAKYTKPGSGIPSTDMTPAVQTSLGLANSALQSAPVTTVAGRTGAVVIAEADVTSLTSDLAALTSGVSTNAGAISTEATNRANADALLAPKASPTFTGVPLAPTATALTSNTQLATTAYADGAVTAETSRATTAEALKVGKGTLVFNVRDYGAVGNYKTFATGGMTATSAVFTDATNGSFTSANIGQLVTVAGAGAAGVDLSTTISSITSSTVVVLAVAASTTVSAASYGYGTSDSTAINAAVTAAGSVGGSVYLPPGGYCLSAVVVPANNVSLVGAGIGNTILYPFGTVAAVQLQASSGSPLANFAMAHLTIDGVRQAGAYNVATKGIFIQYTSHMTLEDLVVQNCVATGIGTDFLAAGSTIHNCRAINNGRLNHAGANGAGANGIGIGTGGYTVEDWVVSDCFASGNGRYGIMMECQFPALATMSYGMRISNCYSTGNFNHGYGDAGGNGAIWTGCIAYNNAFDGFSIDNGTIGATAQPSANSTYSGCVAISNARYGFSYQPTANNAQSVAGGGNHSYRGCKSFLNTSLGFNINSAASHPVSGMTYTDCEAFSNGASGLQVQAASNDIIISGCKFNANGQTSSTSKVGILIGAAVTGLQISGCRCYDDNGTQKQAYGIQVATSITVTTAQLVNNDLRGNLTGSFNMLGTWASAILDNNAGYAGTATRSAGPSSASSVRGDTLANWLSNNPTLNLGEIAYETDTHCWKVGDGATAWGGLSYARTPNIWTPAVSGLIAATGDMATMPSQSGITPGRAFFVAVQVEQALTASGIAAAYVAATSGNVNTNSFISVYASTGPGSTGGALLAQTADLSTTAGLTTTTGAFVVEPFASAATITGLKIGQWIYLSIINNYTTTGPQWISTRLFGTNLSGGSSGPNVTNSIPRLYVSSGTYTTPPSTVPALSASNTNSVIGIGLTQ